MAGLSKGLVPAPPPAYHRSVCLAELELENQITPTTKGIITAISPHAAAKEKGGPRV